MGFPRTSHLPRFAGDAAGFRAYRTALKTTGYPLVAAPFGEARFTPKRDLLEGIRPLSVSRLWRADATGVMALLDMTGAPATRLPELIPQWDKAGLWKEAHLFRLLDIAAPHALEVSYDSAGPGLFAVAVDECHRLALDGRFTPQVFNRYLGHLQSGGTPLDLPRAAVLFNALGVLALHGFAVRGSVDAVLSAWGPRLDSHPDAVRLFSMMRECGLHATKPGTNLYEELLVDYVTRHRRAVLFGSDARSSFVGLGDWIRYLAFPAALRTEGHKIGFSRDTLAASPIGISNPDDLVRLADLYGFEMVNDPVSATQWDVVIDDLRPELAGRRFSLSLLTGVPHQRVCGVPWMGPLPFGRRQWASVYSYVEPERVVRRLTDAPRPFHQRFPSPDSHVAESYLRMSGFAAGHAPQPVIIVNPYKAHGLSPRGDPVAFWTDLVGELSDLIPGALFLVCDPHKDVDKRGDRLMFSVVVRVGAERVYNIGFPDLRTLRGLHGMIETVAVVGGDTGTVQHLVATSGVMSYFFAGTQFGPASNNLWRWTPPTMRAVGFYNPAVLPRDLGKTIAWHLVRHVDRRWEPAFSPALRAGRDRPQPHWPVDRVSQLRSRLIHGDGTLSPRELARRTLDIVEEVVTADPENPLLRWDAAHAIRGAMNLVKRDPRLTRAITEKIASSPVLHALRPYFEEMKGIIADVDANEILYGPLMSALVRSAGYDPVTYFTEYHI